MHSMRRLLKFLHGLSKLTVAFLPMFIVLFIFLAIFQLKTDIQRDIKDIKRVYKNDRAILEKNLADVKSNLRSLKTVKDIKSVELQFSGIYDKMKEEVQKDKEIVDKVLLAQWVKIKSDTKAIKQSIDTMKDETDKLMEFVKSIPLTIDLPLNIQFEIPGMKELIQLLTNNLISRVLISIGESFYSIDIFKNELINILKDGIQAVEIEEIKRLTAQIAYLSDDIKDDIVLIKQSITTIKSMLSELGRETKEAIHSPISMSSLIYGALSFCLSLFYFAYLTIRYRFFGPFFEAIELIKLSFHPLKKAN